MNVSAAVIILQNGAGESESENEYMLNVRVERKYLRERYNIFDLPEKK